MSQTLNLLDNVLSSVDCTNSNEKKQQPQKPRNKARKQNKVSPITGVDQVVDYTTLCREFGCQLLTNDLLIEIEKLTKQKPHEMLRRNLYYAHRDLHKILQQYQNGQPFYLYTGRGPSSKSMHLGHMIPFLFTKYLQDAFNIPCVIQITNDEKFFYKSNIKTLDQAYEYAMENIKDIIAMGFDINKTFIFIDTDYIEYMYPNICRVQNKITYNTMKAVFGLNQSSSVGKIAYPSIQVVPAFSSTFKQIFGEENIKGMRCLIPCAIDQDPYFRICRDIAPKLKEKKCSCLYSKFIPGLRGKNGKMSSSDPTSAIFLNDTPKQIRKKIFRYALSGGQVDIEEHRKKGANLDDDVSYQYLRYFLNDDEEMERITNEYKSGKMLTSEVKNKLCDVLIPIITEFQEKRKQITDEDIKGFMKVRRLKTDGTHQSNKNGKGVVFAVSALILIIAMITCYCINNNVVIGI